MIRHDGRGALEIRPLKITRNYLDFAEGSALVEWGRNKVLCAASLEDRVPPFLVGTGKGWLTAEYAMLPKSSKQRIQRKESGRSIEIQRLIGRSLRAVVDTGKIGDRTIYIDCDVIQADGGTRTASITGAMVALYDALALLKEGEALNEWPLFDFVAAVSVGIVKGEVLVDLDYVEDSSAEVDMNVVMTATGRFIEVQGTAEGAPFSQEQLTQLLDGARVAVNDIVAIQRQVLGLA